MSDEKSRQDEKDKEQLFCRSDSKWWVLGLFYYNKDDFAIFIRKRVSPGITLNYGHKAVQIGIAVIVILVVAFVIIMESR